MFSGVRMRVRFQSRGRKERTTRARGLSGGDRRWAGSRRREKDSKCACHAPHALLLCRRRTPSYAYALLLLMILEVALIWRLYPYSAPIGPVAA